MLDALFSKLMQPDTLAAIASRVLEQHLAPLLAEIRSEILSKVTGTMPATFTARLNAQGVAVGDDGAQVLWRATIGALADEPAGNAAS